MILPLDGKGTGQIDGGQAAGLACLARVPRLKKAYENPHYKVFIAGKQVVLDFTSCADNLFN